MSTKRQTRPETSALAKRSEQPSIDELRRRIAVARGQQVGDLLLRGGRVVNVFTGSVEAADVVTVDGWIAGVGRCQWEARETISLSGKYILPGLIDAHMHLESTMLMPGELARLVVPYGTSTIIADPHEMANVMGARGVELLLDASEGLPLDIFFMAPSCVPATEWEDAGAQLDSAAIRRLMRHERVLGLAEVMDVQAVLDVRQGILTKMMVAHRQGAAIDGHAPALAGRRLAAYAAAGVRSDHESTTADEALDKARLGMLVQVREGSSARNLDAMLPLMMNERLGDCSWCLCTDDIEPGDLIDRGHINGMLNRVVAAGLPLAKAVRHCTLVPARHYGLVDRGAIAPGYRANLMVLSEAGCLRPQLVIHRGVIVAREGSYLPDRLTTTVREENSVRVAPLSKDDFKLRISGSTCPVICVKASQIVTQRQDREVRRKGTSWHFEEDQDVALIASIERHRATGRIGLGLVSGLGLRRGAIGSSVAHDSHNLLVAGTNPRDMLRCTQTICEMGGGLVVVDQGRIAARLSLPVAGLLSTANVETVVTALRDVRQAARRVGCTLPRPFGTLSFLALPVIPELRITDRGLFDVTEGKFINL